jgi:RimJ/RimL family protein N-acetyltransferase
VGRAGLPLIATISPYQNIGYTGRLGLTIKWVAMPATGKVNLESMTEGDLSLRQAIESDPRMMSELGGTNTADQIARAHAGALKMAAAGTCWYFKVVPEGTDRAVGYIGIWESLWQGATIYEMGWMILPEFQGKGLATAAGKELIAKARAERKFKAVHAFPGKANIASNKICEKLGFSKLEECDVDYQGRTLRCNDWCIEVF